MPEKKHLHWYAVFSNVSFGALIIFVPTILNWGKVDLIDLVFQSIEVFGFGAFLVVQGVLNWWSFVYWIEGDDLRIQQGVFTKKDTTIPMAKIRAVELNDSIGKRLLGVVRMQIKTAATGTQGDIVAISRNDARKLQEAIRRHADFDEDNQQARENAKSADLRTLLVAGMTSGNLFFGIGAVWFIDLIFGSFFDTPTIDLYIAGFAANWIDATVVLLAGYLPLTLLVATIFEAIRFGNFKVWRTESELHIRHGLLTRQSVTVPLDRVQAVHFVQNPLRQIFGVGAVKVEAVGHAEEKGASSELFPLIREREFEDFLGLYVPELAGVVEMKRPPRRALIRFLLLPSFIVALPCTILTVISPWAAVSFVSILPVWLFKYLDYKQSGGGISGDLGAFENRTFVMREIYKVPRKAVRSVQLKRSFFARRRRLATLDFTIATGALGKTVTAENLDEEVADAFLSWRPGVNHSTSL